MKKSGFNWDEEEQTVTDVASTRKSLKPYFIGAGVCVALLVAVGSYRLINPERDAGDVYAMYLKGENARAHHYGVELLRDRSLNRAQQNQIREVLYSLYTTNQSGFYNVDNALAMGSDLFRAKPETRLARELLAIIDEHRDGDIELALDYHEHLAELGSMTSTLSLVDYYISTGERADFTEALRLLDEMPQTADVKMKKALIYSSRESGNYNSRRAQSMVEDALRLGSGEAAAYLAHQKIEEIKKMTDDADEQIDEFVGFVQKAHELGYIGDRAEELIAIMELGRHSVPRDPSFAQNYRAFIEAKIAEAK